MNDKVEGPNTRFSITDREALQFHSRGRPGKLEIAATKPMATQRDLSLAYSPGVAVPVKAIAADPQPPTIIRRAATWSRSLPMARRPGRNLSALADR